MKALLAALSSVALFCGLTSAIAGAEAAPPTARAASCGVTPGLAGEYDGLTSQGAASGPNQSALAARRIWFFREPQSHSNCQTKVIFVFEFRDGSNNAGCRLNTSSTAFLALGDFAFQASSSFSRVRSFSHGASRYTLRMSGTIARNGSARGSLRATATEAGSRCDSGVVTWTARHVSALSGVFKPGGQGYAIKRDVDRRHPDSTPPVCDGSGADRTCSGTGF